MRGILQARGPVGDIGQGQWYRDLGEGVGLALAISNSPYSGAIQQRGQCINNSGEIDQELGGPFNRLGDWTQPDDGRVSVWLCALCVTVYKLSPLIVSPIRIERDSEK